MSDKNSPVYLDANCFITAIESNGEAAERLKDVFEAASGFQGRLMTSELTLAEVMVGVEKRRQPWLKRLYLELLVWSRVVDLRPVSRNILYSSAKLRAHHPKERMQKKLYLPDFIHLATAIEGGCEYLLTDDHDIAPPDGGPKLIRSDSLGASIVIRAITRSL